MCSLKASITALFLPPGNKEGLKREGKRWGEKVFLPPRGNYILIRVTKDLNLTLRLVLSQKELACVSLSLSSLNCTVLRVRRNDIRLITFSWSRPSSPCLLLSGLCCYGLYNYLIIKWRRSFYSAVCKVLYSFYEGDFLNYPVTPFLRLPLLTPSLSLYVFQTSDAVCPMIQNSLQHPPTDELKVFLWHSRPWWGIQKAGGE